MGFRKEYIVRFGRLDNTAIKSLFFQSKKQALIVANSLSYVFWYQHYFKAADMSEGPVRIEQEGFFVEIKEK